MANINQNNKRTASVFNISLTESTIAFFIPYNPGNMFRIINGRKYTKIITYYKYINIIQVL